jgi:arylformamidase
VKRIIDISVGISPGLLTWPGDPPLEVRRTSSLEAGDAANVSEIRLGTHAGTHVDPPLHFLEGGPGADEIPLDVLVGDALVADLTGARAQIGPDELEALSLPEHVTRLLLRTSNTARWGGLPREFPEEYAALSPEGAEWMVSRGIRLVGTDFLSIEKRGTPGHPTHVTLLRSGVVIVEGLDLSGVEPGPYTLVCLPLKVVGGDGAPARAILIES